MSVFIIAEAGSSHDNDWDKAAELIFQAREAGADAVKFQFWSDSKALATRRGIPNAAPNYEAFRLRREWLPKLKAECDKIGLEFMVTAFLIEDIPIVNEFVKRFKVSAYECEWKEFIEAHEVYDKDIIISANPHQAPHWNRKRSKHILCISKYPCPVEDLQLHLIGQRNLAGLSDHSQSTITGALAVVASTHKEKYIEKHFRLGDTMHINPDYGHSLLPSDLMYYIDNIRLAEVAL